MLRLCQVWVSLGGNWPYSCVSSLVSFSPVPSESSCRCVGRGRVIRGLKSRTSQISCITCHEKKNTVTLDAGHSLKSYRDFVVLTIFIVLYMFVWSFCEHLKRNINPYLRRPPLSAFIPRTRLVISCRLLKDILISVVSFQNNSSSPVWNVSNKINACHRHRHHSSWWWWAGGKVRSLVGTPFSPFLPCFSVWQLASWFSARWVIRGLGSGCHNVLAGQGGGSHCLHHYAFILQYNRGQ